MNCLTIGFNPGQYLKILIVMGENVFKFHMRLFGPTTGCVVKLQDHRIDVTLQKCDQTLRWTSLGHSLGGNEDFVNRIAKEVGCEKFGEFGPSWYNVKLYLYLCS